MTPLLRPRRSVLYMPGSNARAQEKAKTLAADGIILDLEDSTAPDAKVAARDVVRGSLGSGGFGQRELIVRVNSFDTPWGRDDVRAVAGAAPHAVLVPKVERPEQIAAVSDLLDQSGAPSSTRLWLMIETPLGVLNVKELAATSPRVACLVLGTSDLTKDLRARHTALRLPMLTALAFTLLAARAYGQSVLDGVFLDLADEAGFAAACVQGVELGFDGKTLIHPSQIAPCNAAFSPDAAALDHARRVIAAHAEAERAGKGVVVLDGKLVENLHVEEAVRLVALGEAIAARAAD